MTKDNSTHDRSLGLTPAQVVGSALAAMSGAFLASWLGTTGTLVGAAVGSVVATIGAAIYTHSLRRTAEAVKRTAVQARHGVLLTGAVPRPDPNAPRRGEPVAPTRAEVEPTERRGRLATLLDLPWLKVTLASLAVLVAALGGVTAVEGITGKPIASLLGQDDGTGTTVGHVVGSDTSSTPSDKTPKQQTPATPDPTPSEAPSEQPRQPVPSTSPTPTPSTGPDTPAPDDSQVPVPDTQP